MTVVEIDPLVEHFLTRLRTVCQYYANLEDTASKKWALTHDFEELFRLIEEEGEEAFGETQERYADLVVNDITADAERLLNRIKQEKEGEEE